MIHSPGRLGREVGAAPRLLVLPTFTRWSAVLVLLLLCDAFAAGACARGRAHPARCPATQAMARQAARVSVTATAVASDLMGLVMGVVSVDGVAWFGLGGV